MTYLSSKLQCCISTTTLHRAFPDKCRGFSLLELLISLLIFAVGILGLASLQNVSMKMTHDSVLQNSAISLSSTLIERIRIQGESAYLADWYRRVENELPQGHATIVNQGGNYQLKIEWQESQLSDNPNSLQTYQHSFQVHH